MHFVKSECPTPTSKWSMDEPLVHIECDFLLFSTPYTCVTYTMRQCQRTFSGGRISAFFDKIFSLNFSCELVISNSSLHYQIIEFDANIIQIIVWIIGSGDPTFAPATIAPAIISQKTQR